MKCFHFLLPQLILSLFNLLASLTREAMSACYILGTELTPVVVQPHFMYQTRKLPLIVVYMCTNHTKFAQILK